MDALEKKRTKSVAAENLGQEIVLRDRWLELCYPTDQTWGTAEIWSVLSRRTRPVNQVASWCGEVPLGMLNPSRHYTYSRAAVPAIRLTLSDWALFAWYRSQRQELRRPTPDRSSPTVSSPATSRPRGAQIHHGVGPLLPRPQGQDPACAKLPW